MRALFVVNIYTWRSHVLLREAYFFSPNTIVFANGCDSADFSSHRAAFARAVAGSSDSRSAAHRGWQARSVRARAPDRRWQAGFLGNVGMGERRPAVRRALQRSANLPCVSKHCL